MNKEDFVSYEQAVKLKAAGFDWSCEAFYEHNDAQMWVSTDGEEDWNCGVDYSAPTLWQAQKWLREVKRLSVEPYANIIGQFNYNISDLDSFADSKGDGAGCPSYEQALSAGIDAALELIEKKGGSK